MTATGPAGPGLRAATRSLSRAESTDVHHPEKWLDYIAHMDEVPQGVGRTALGTAWIRAEASRQPDRLFDDWLAQAFVDAAPDATPALTAETRDRMGGLADTLFTYLVTRTRLFDDELTTAAAAGCRQVVLLAAGLDSRAFRLPWPAGTQLFEIDQPDLLSFKEQVLAATGLRPRCTRTPVAADLTADWPDRLSRAGFRPGEPTAWLAEGILVYLEADEAERILTAVTDLSAPSSHLALEDARGLSWELLERAASLGPLDGFADLWKGGLHGESPAWLGDHHWRGREIAFAPLAVELGQPEPTEQMPVEGFFVSAQRVGPWEQAGIAQAGATQSGVTQAGIGRAGIGRAVRAATDTDLAGHGAARR